MKIINSDIPDIKIIEPTKFEDSRGFFMESFRRDWFKDNIANYDFVQENHSKSEFGVLRGLHYQISNPQGKLVRVISGEVFDVAVDLRSSSKTFGDTLEKFYHLIISIRCGSHQVLLMDS